jgi:hypothetical protein
MARNRKSQSRQSDTQQSVRSPDVTEGMEAGAAERQNEIERHSSESSGKRESNSGSNSGSNSATNSGSNSGSNSASNSGSRSGTNGGSRIGSSDERSHPSASDDPGFTESNASSSKRGDSKDRPGRSAGEDSDEESND